MFQKVFFIRSDLEKDTDTFDICKDFQQILIDGGALIDTAQPNRLSFTFMDDDGDIGLDNLSKTFREKGWNIHRKPNFHSLCEDNISVFTATYVGPQ